MAHTTLSVYAWAENKSIFLVIFFMLFLLKEQRGPCGTRCMTHN